ncbi:conserved hypothetical protein [Burkholderia mallei PRL-20]|nr:conserved hypothetical protein [Burkholderia pseudomallei 1106a]ABO02645.1 conserved hypothetical protein [Burkholderia mallei NCTC 10247]AFR19969.1 hypothetical protein BPC006_II2043 [Burkholderia pseudomallei BPC006]EBA46648.1 hypothetical protein BURPS305_2123 [Burkholderia pseudomallei 305]EDK55660.1 hypothetical protein BMAFMH_E0766 [Burkholderia mallei FMH]EDO90191.1 conserved hypothetical protein [Burkholderia pseudomallei Pasteur 52237]EDP87099.1 conserved hypothetical protein [Bur
MQRIGGRPVRRASRTRPRNEWRAEVPRPPDASRHAGRETRARRALTAPGAAPA